MKKKLISIGLAAVMTAALFPVTAMAGTTTYVNKVVQVENGDTTDETSLLVIKDVNGDIDRDISNGDPVEFTIELDGAEWRTDDDMINNTSYHDVQSAVENYDTNVYFTKVSNNKAVIEINNSADNYYYYIPLYTTIKTDGDAVIALDGRSSVVTGGTFTFASPTGGSGSGSGGNTSGGGPLVYVNKTVTLAKGDETNDSSLLVIKDRNNDIYNAVGNGDQVSFAIELNGAEWINDENMMWSGYDLQTAVESYNDNNISFTKISSTKAEIEINNYYSGGYIYIPLFTVIRSKGNITLTVNGRNSVIPSGTYTYAVAVTPSVSVGIAGTKDIPEYGTRIKDITFSESVAGSLETGVIKLKLSRGFRFDTYNSSITKVLGDGSILSNPSMISDREIEIYVEHTSIVSALEFILKGINVTPDDAQVGDTASITVSGAGITPTTFDVGTYVDSVVEAAIFDNADIYGNVEIPVMYAGKVYDDKYHTTLPIQVSESTAGSLNASGSLTFTFPEGVKVTTGYYNPDKGYDYAEGICGTGIYEVDSNDPDAWDNIDTWQYGYDYEIKNNVVTIKNIMIDNPTAKTKMTFAFNLAISPEFSGDVDVVVGGKAIASETTLTVAEVVPGFTVEADLNQVEAGNRNVPLSDIVIKEAASGLFEKDDVIYLAVENMQFEKGMTYEVTAGDIEVDDIRINGGAIVIEIKDSSFRGAGEITLSNVKAYLDKSLPDGDYDIIAEAAGSSLFDSCNLERKQDTVYFNINDITLVPGYIHVGAGEVNPDEPDEPDDPETEYNITLNTGANGTASISATQAKAGRTIIVRGEPDNGYEIDKIMYKPVGGTYEDITDTGRFIMPAAAVTVKVTFKEAVPSGAKITVSDASIHSGEEFSVPVIISENPGIISMEFSVEYDENLLEWTGVASPEGEENVFGGTFDAQVGRKITWYADDPASNNTTNGVIAILTFTAKDLSGDENTSVELTQISINYDEDYIFDADEDNVAFSVVPGEIRITAYLPGDINGDGEVTNKDITRLMRYIKYRDVEVVETALDVNGDGTISNKDVTRLMRYIKYHDVEIH